MTRTVPLWFGEGDLATPDFIRTRRSKRFSVVTFYNHNRGRADLRDTIKTYLDGLYGVDINLIITVQLYDARTQHIALALGRGDHGLIVSQRGQT